MTSAAEKERNFEDRYRRGAVCSDLYNLIPERLKSAGAIAEAFVDSDGYWIYLEHGWNCDEDIVIHAYTTADIIDAVKMIKMD